MSAEHAKGLPERKLEHLPELDKAMADALLMSEEVREQTYELWEGAIKVSDGDEDAIYFFRRSAHIVRLIGKPDLHENFMNRFFYVLPDHLRIRAWQAEDMDRREEELNSTARERKNGWWSWLTSPGSGRFFRSATPTR